MLNMSIEISPSPLRKIPRYYATVVMNVNSAVIRMTPYRVVVTRCCGKTFHANTIHTSRCI